MHGATGAGHSWKKDDTNLENVDPEDFPAKNVAARSTPSMRKLGYRENELAFGSEVLEKGSTARRTRF